MRLTHVKEDIVQRHLGLPPDLLSTSLLPWEGIADLVAALGEHSEHDPRRAR
jgi:hypothetical protein